MHIWEWNSMTIAAIDVCSYPGRLPGEGSSKPWQVCVHGKVTVYGLPPSQACRSAAYLLQNQAAISAGWTEDSSWGCDK